MTTIRKPTKTERILTALIHGEKLHRFNAFEYRETCLHSTISLLHNNYGLYFERKPITVMRQGDKVNVKLYWLPPKSRPRAHAVLNQMRARRGLIGGSDGQKE